MNKGDTYSLVSRHACGHHNMDYECLKQKTKKLTKKQATQIFYIKMGKCLHLS